MVGVDILSQNKVLALEICLNDLMWLPSQVRGAQQYWILPVMSMQVQMQISSDPNLFGRFVYTRARKCCQLLTYLWKQTDVHTEGLSMLPCTCDL